MTGGGGGEASTLSLPPPITKYKKNLVKYKTLCYGRNKNKKYKGFDKSCCVKVKLYHF